MIKYLKKIFHKRFTFLIGPLTYEDFDTGVLTLGGIIAATSAAGSPKGQSGATSVYAHKDWIETTMQNNKQYLETHL